MIISNILEEKSDSNNPPCCTYSFQQSEPIFVQVLSKQTSGKEGFFIQIFKNTFFLLTEIKKT